MTPENDALVILLGMEKYSGSEEAFLRESVTRLRAALNCSQEQSESVIARLRKAREIDIAMTPGRELHADENIPFAKWYWKIPEASAKQI